MYVASMVRDALPPREDVTAAAFSSGPFGLLPLHPRAWVFGIARNAALDELRRRKRVAPLDAAVFPPIVCPPRWRSCRSCTHVRARTQSSQDVTSTFVSAQDRLEQANAEHSIALLSSWPAQPPKRDGEHPRGFASPAWRSRRRARRAATAAGAHRLQRPCR